MSASSRIVGVLMGGMSSEREVSLKTGKAVSRALRSRGYDVREIDVNEQLPERLREEGVAVAWLALHGRFGEDGCVQGLLEVMGIPYTGSGVLASAVAMDKIRTKRVLAEHAEVVMARDWVLSPGDPIPEVRDFPVIVKPSVGGSTIGMARCNDQVALERAVTDALTHDDEVLIERCIEGDEITVAVLDGVALPVVRIVTAGGFFDFDAKYDNEETVYEVPAPISEEVARDAQNAAVRAYAVLGCVGLARADFMVDGDGTPHFLEINTLPGMTETSLSPMAAKASGISFDELVERILKSAHCVPRVPLG